MMCSHRLQEKPVSTSYQDHIRLGQIIYEGVWSGIWVDLSLYIYTARSLGYDGVVVHGCG